ncbi:MAG: septal ring lytic transglycosylase RlpA family protein [Solirubrobacteraceae bacterium]
MRAIRNLRLPGAAMTVAGALALMLTLCGLTLGGGAAVAQVRRGQRRTAARHRHHHGRRLLWRHHDPHHRRHGALAPLLPEVASWYYDQGYTACGFHAQYGIANKTLPCGTRVRLRYGGQSVVATVDDRGPYVYGRSFDLDQNTATALGMSGVVTLYASLP